MTELKIKQADINNNGNQRLMGDMGGWVKLKICIMYVCGCGTEKNTTLESSRKVLLADNEANE